MKNGKSSLILDIVKGFILVLQVLVLVWVAILILPSLLNLKFPDPVADPSTFNQISLSAQASTPTLSPSVTPADVYLKDTPTTPPFPSQQAPLAQEGLCSPLKGILLRDLNLIISDGYHPPPPGKDGRHMGIDFAFYKNEKGRAIEGYEIDSILPGKVVSVVFDRPPFGNMAIIETSYHDVGTDLANAFQITTQQSLYHLYAHMRAAPSVDPGYAISCGQFIGIVGDTGASGNSHLHLETRFGKPGQTFPSLGYDLTNSAQIAMTEAEKKAYFLWETSGEFQHFDPLTLLNSYQIYVQSH
ncbi:MAG: peptidoglycan DD-metalloendopeptidase family protein [Chloroflexota bacterium]